MKRLILTLMLLLPANMALGADAPASAPTTQVALHAKIEKKVYWNLLRTEQFGIGIPNRWSNRPAQPNMLVFIGMNSKDLKDETRQPLDLGLSIERLAKSADSLDDDAKKLVARYAQVKSVTIEGKPNIEHIKLSDGHDAVLVTLSMLSGNRRTLMRKLLASSAENRWVVSGFITAGEKSILTEPDRDMAKKVRAHLETFTFDANNINQDPLNRAYLAPQQPDDPTSQPAEKK